MKRELNCNSGTFEYIPQSKTLRVFIGMDFQFNVQSGEFELNKNPFGDSKGSKITDILISEDLLNFSFKSNTHGKLEEFKITGQHAFSKILFSLLSERELQKLNFSDDNERITIEHENGILSKIFILKRDLTGTLLESLSIISESGQMYFMRKNPWGKLKVKSLEMSKNLLCVKTKGSEFKYTFGLQPFIFSIVTNLLTYCD